MKFTIYFLLLTSIYTICCKSQPDKKHKLNENLNNISIYKKEVSFGTSKKFDSLFNLVEVIHDSLKGHRFLEDNFKNIDCKCQILYSNDYYNDNDELIIREVEIILLDTLKINVLMKLFKGNTKYIYSYKNHVFKIKNFYGDMYNIDSEIDFHFDTRESYSKSEGIFLMREQPSRWSGLANEYEFYQIVNLNKMEILQFAERDDKLN